MNPLLEKLLVLQDRDARLSKLELETKRIPVEQAGIDAQEKAEGTAVENAKAEAKKAELERKKLESDVNTKEEQIRKYKTQLLEIKNNDQFHALQHEIKHVEEEVRKIEDQELELMEKYEAAKVVVQDVEANFKKSVQKFAAQKQELAKKSEAVQKQKAELAEERKKLAEGVEEDVLGRYERIFRSKNGQAIVRISHGLCLGCHLKVTAQEIHHAQQEGELVTCTNCGRILYWDGE